MNKTTKRIISLLYVAVLAVSLAVVAVGCANKSGEAADNLDTQFNPGMLEAFLKLVDEGAFSEADRVE